MSGQTAGVEGLPVIDVAPLRDGTDIPGVATRIDDACRRWGFFTVVGHGVPSGLHERLDRLARAFFALPDEEKADIAMARGGPAWRGWFPLGGELTSGVPDGKEGLYLGEELGPDDPRVRGGWPLHGANLFPERPEGLRDAVLGWIHAVTSLGQDLLSAMAVGLGLDERWFADHLTGEPLVMLRLFHYPPLTGEDGADRWSVGEHTDYGLLTVLAQDDVGGLQVRGPDGWVDVPADPSALVVNLGDMLERMTGGRYRSTVHRVRNVGDRDRLSIPLFLDPVWDAEVRPLPGAEVPDPSVAADRWDGASVHELSGPYGDYLLAKVSRVFPDLFSEVVERP